MTDITRSELDAKLEAVEARMDARLARIEAMVEAMRADVSSLKSDVRSQRYWVMGTAIAMVAAVFAAMQLVLQGVSIGHQQARAAEPAAVASPTSPSTD